jgi:hypothetical protein
MSTRSHWPDLGRRLPGGSGRASLLVSAIIAFSVCSGIVQVADFALAGSRGPMRVSVTSPALSAEDSNANLDAAVMAADLVELPSASVEAISL